MSFQVKLYEFQKRHNSTRRPEGAEWGINGVLREGSSLITPTISFQFATDFSPMSNNINLKFNYAYVAKFARYYWITDWTYEGGLWHASMKVDVLASFRPEILAAQHLFIAYQSRYANTLLVDPRMSMVTQNNIDTQTAVFQKIGQHVYGGVIIVMCTGNNSTCAFALTESDIKNLMNNVINWWTQTFTDPSSIYPGNPNDSWPVALWNALVGSVTWWKKVIVQLFSNGDASANIRSAVQLPIDIQDVNGSSQTVYLGQYDTGMTAKRVTSRILHDQVSLTIPWRWSDWRNNEPYTEIFLFIPYVGNIKMPNSILIGNTALKVEAIVDIMSGDAIFTVYVDPVHVVVGTYSVNIGAGYPIGMSNVNAGQVVTGIAGAAAAIAGAVASGGTSAAIAGTAGAISGIAAANSPTSSCIGGGGGGAALGFESYGCVLSVITHTTVTEPNNPDDLSTIGVPFMKCSDASLESFADCYVETRSAAVSGNMTATEHAEINALLDSGVYLETGG